MPAPGGYAANISALGGVSARGRVTALLLWAWGSLVFWVTLDIMRLFVLMLLYFR